MLTEWKKQEELEFLNEVSCVPLQQGLRHLQTAFTNFFAGRTKYPTFKKKHQGGSAEFTKSYYSINKTLHTEVTSSCGLMKNGMFFLRVNLLRGPLQGCCHRKSRLFGPCKNPKQKSRPSRVSRFEITVAMCTYHM